MATVIAFEELVAARRRLRAQQVHAACVALLEASCASLRHELPRYDLSERQLWAERLRRMEELLEYARQWS
jgi:hypothetical protein